MRKILHVILALFCGFAQASVVSAYSIGFTPNGSYSWDIIFSGVPLNQGIAAFDFDVSYNPGTVAASSVDFGPWLGDTSLPAYTLADSVSQGGLIDLKSWTWYTDEQWLYDNIQYAANGSFLLATLNFNPVGPGGNPDLAFINWYTGDGSPPYNNDIKLYNNEPYTPPVPEPGTILLLGSGIAALLPFRRKILRRFS